MPKTLFLRVAPLAMLLALAVSLSGVGLGDFGPTEPLASTVPTVSAELFATPFGSSGLISLCPQIEGGCTFSDIACSGYNCCCIYSCPDGTAFPANCWLTGGPGPV
ncbi:MAG: hypothetical protein AAGC60_17340 [Acidobacteriota bacterium]